MHRTINLTIVFFVQASVVSRSRPRTVAHEYEKFRQEYGLFEAERQRLVEPQLAAEAGTNAN